MKTISELKRDINHIPDDTPICESCNYELVETDEGTDFYCPNEMCLDHEQYSVK